MWCFRYVSGWLAARDYFVCRGIRGGGGLGVPGCLEWRAGYLWWRTARGGLISVFEEFSAIVDKAFVLAGGLGDELSFIGVQEIS